MCYGRLHGLGREAFPENKVQKVEKATREANNIVGGNVTDANVDTRESCNTRVWGVFTVMGTA